MNTYQPSRRTALKMLTLFGASMIAARAGAAGPELTAQVWKSPTCGCCNDWIKHLEANGFTVSATNIPDSRYVRAQFGMPSRYASCHTALIGGYVVEGHVPAREIKRLLREKPQALGIAVPGMPIGSPGMDGPSYRGVRDMYDVLLVQRDGRANVFASYG